MSGDQFSGAFAITPVVGTRSFHVDGNGRLRGVVYQQVWEPGENEATCWPGANRVAIALNRFGSRMAAAFGGSLDDDTDTLDDDFTTPRPIRRDRHKFTTHTCGFYAYYDGSNDYASPDRITGIVQGYGDVVIGTRGFRATKSRILALYVPPEPRKSAHAWRRPGIADSLAYCISWGIAGAVGAVLGALHEPTDWIEWLVLAASAVAATYFTVESVSIARADRWYAAGEAPAPKRGVRRGSYHDFSGGRRRLVREALAAAAKKKHLTPELLDRVRANYPDLPVYRDLNRMLADFPPDRGEEPTPENTPDFWKREAA